MCEIFNTRTTPIGPEDREASSLLRYACLRACTLSPMGCSASKDPGTPGMDASRHGGRQADAAKEPPSEPSPAAGPLTSADIQGRHTGTAGTQVYELGNGTRLRYAVLSQRGYYPEDLHKANQDQFKVVEAFDAVPGDILLSVFDGHGKDGDKVSAYARDRIEKELIHQLKKAGATSAASSTGKACGSALTKTFLRINKELLITQDFDTHYSGTTAVSALFRGGQLHVGNVGDSRIIIAERRGEHVVAVPLSWDQTPYRRDERERWYANSGWNPLDWRCPLSLLTSRGWHPRLALPLVAAHKSGLAP